MSIGRICLCVALAVCAMGTVRADSPPAPPALVPLAHSALIAVNAAPAAGGITLRVQRAGGDTPLAVDDLTVSIDGVTAAATAHPDGSWFLARPPGAQDAGKLIEVTVGHDGIHEVLSGRLAGPAGAAPGAHPATAPALSSSRKQLFWWVLNIAIVLIAAIAISRRTS